MIYLQSLSYCIYIGQIVVVQHTRFSTRYFRLHIREHIWLETLILHQASYSLDREGEGSGEGEEEAAEKEGGRGRSEGLRM